MAQAKLTKREGMAHTIETATGHTVRFDEPETKGGANTASSPTEMLASALVACTAMTLKLYADRKEWNIDGIEVEVNTTFEGPRPGSYQVKLELPDHLDEEQKRRLRVIAGKCPVHRTLTEAIPVEFI